MKYLYVKKLHEKAIIPKYQYYGDVGFDLSSIYMHSIKPGEIELIHTGLCFKIPYGYEITVRQRSGLSIMYPNYISIGIGTIDTSYLGEIIIPIINNRRDNKIFEINPGDRIAQGVLSPIMVTEIIEVEELEKTERGSKGFGSTGV